MKPTADELAPRIRALLDKQLRTETQAPLCVGYSGGGDSQFLLRQVLAWGAARDRPVFALTVDHGLQPQSQQWAAHCARRAAELGAGFRLLRWDGDKPETGVAAAARSARHRLLAEATRETGANVLLLGHTQDDLFEAELMALEGCSVGQPRQWAPSPVWPEGRGVFLLRPLLSLRRSDIREALTRLSDTWLDDPANESTGSLRAEMRRRLARMPGVEPLSLDQAPQVEAPDAQVEGDAFVGLTLDWPLSATWLGMACLCIGGGQRPPRRDRLVQLWDQLAQCDGYVGTLSGARIERRGDQLHLIRNHGDMVRSGCGPVELVKDQPTVWDGRIEFIAGTTGMMVLPLADITSQLSDDQKADLKASSASTRKALPGIVRPDGSVFCPWSQPAPDLQMTDLVRVRFAAATGKYDREA